MADFFPPFKPLLKCQHSGSKVGPHLQNCSPYRKPVFFLMKLIFWNYTFIYLLVLYFLHQTIELHEDTGHMYLFDLHLYKTEQMTEGCPTRGPWAAYSPGWL